MRETNHSWVENYNGIEGLNGMLFISKTIEDSSMFVPASGYYEGPALCNDGQNCYIWSSMLDHKYPDSAYHFYFNNNDCYISNNYNRYYGFAVRGIQNPQ